MIEITGKTTAKGSDKKKIKTKKETRSLKGKEKSFAADLETHIIADAEGTLDELMRDLKDQEKKFLDLQTYNELLHYKALVKKILQSVLHDGFSTQTLKRIRKDRADFTIINNIDKKLLELTNAVTQKNKAFNLLKTIEEIRGLLFDLTH